MNPQTAIIDTTTRVIKRLTTDAIPSFDPTTETAVPMITPITLNGYMVLGIDNVTLASATQAQVNSAGLNENFNATQLQAKRQALKTAIQNMQSDATVSQTVKTAFMAFIQAFLL